MSDLANRNVLTMIEAARSMQAEVSEMRQELRKQDAKIAALTLEVAGLKRAQILASVKAQQALTGQGGTA